MKVLVGEGEGPSRGALRHCDIFANLRLKLCLTLCRHLLLLGPSAAGCSPALPCCCGSEILNVETHPAGDLRVRLGGDWLLAAPGARCGARAVLIKRGAGTLATVAAAVTLAGEVLCQELNCRENTAQNTTCLYTPQTDHQKTDEALLYSTPCRWVYE